MNTPALPWPIERLRQALAPHAPGIDVQAVACIDSSNTELMRRARAGDARPCLLVAEAQTAGRGRLGRQWQTGSGSAGSALAFSLALPLAPREWHGLSLAVGLALAEALHPGVRIKWPNDLWWQGAKLAGILVETASAPGLPEPARQVVIGVGLNIDAPTASDLRTPAAWLRQIEPGAQAPDVLLRLAPPLLQTVRAFEAGGFAPLRDRFAARDALAGRDVQLSDGGEGQARGISATGALLLRTVDGQMREIHSAEVSVRPLHPAHPAAAHNGPDSPDTHPHPAGHKEFV